MSLPVADSAQKIETSRLAVVATCLLILVALIDSQVVAGIAPQVAAGLQTAKATVATSVAVYSVAAAVVALLLGRYSSRIRPVTWLPIAAGLFVVADLLTAISPHILFFFGARALTGLAGGLISALAIAALADASTYANRGKQMSGVAISYFLAPVLGVPFGIFLAGLYGWRVVFGISALSVAAAGLLVRQFPLTARVSSGEAAGVSSTPLSTPAAKVRAIKSLWRLATRSRSTRMGVVSAFFVSGGLVGFITFVGTWLSDAFHAGPREIEFIYALAGIGAVAGGTLGGVLADRFGKRAVAQKSCVGMIIALLLLPTFTWSATLFILIGAAAFFAMLRVAPLQALITELIEPAERATYIALRNAASQLGIAVAVTGGRSIYTTYGLIGVGALCALLTAVAWATIRVIDDPHDRLSSHTERKRARSRLVRLSRAASLGVLALALAICVGLPWLVSLLLTKAHTVYHSDVGRTDTPAAQGAVFEDIKFTSSDGNTLRGWYLPSRGASVTIIMTHGLFRSRYEMLEPGLALWQKGYGVLLYDLRRHGASPAEFSTVGYDERHDVLAAANFARSREPGNRIVLMGVSMGAAATLLAAAEDRQIMAVVAESSFLSFRDTVYHHVALGRFPVPFFRGKFFHLPAFPFATLLVEFTAWRMNFDPADFDELKAVKRISCPILFIGGSADVRMPNDTVLEPMYLAASSPLKRKFIVEGASHGHAYDENPALYIQTVDQFLQAVKSSDSAAP